MLLDRREQVGPMQRFIDWMARGCLSLAALSFAGFFLMIVGQVSYRYLGISLVFSEEAARLLNVYAVFFGLVYVVRAAGDVRINLIDKLIGDRPGVLLGFQVFQFAVMALFLTVLMVGSFLLAETNWRWAMPSMTFLNQGVVYVAPCIGAFLSLVIVAWKLVTILKTGRIAVDTPEELE